MLIEVEAPPTAIDKVPVPTTEVELGTGCEVSVADVARFCTSSEYCPAAAPELVLADAMVLSATVASKPARVLGSSKVDSVDCRVLSALLKVP